MGAIADGKYPSELVCPLEARGVPTDKELEAERQRFIGAKLDSVPFGRRLASAIIKDLSSPSRFRNFARHNYEVYTSIGTISDNVASLARCASQIDRDLIPETWKRLRLAAFLHDIGKSLDPSRHPILGWHVMVDLASVVPSDRQAAERLCAELEDLKPTKGVAAGYRYLASLVRDHDKFGNLTTGEASFVALARIASIGGGPQSLWQQVRDTWLLTLADIAGTSEARAANRGAQLLNTCPCATQQGPLSCAELAATLQMRDENLAMLCEDWRALAPILTEPSYVRVTQALRDYSETPEATLRRIKRLLRARAGTWPKVLEALDDDTVESALDTYISSKDFLPFCRDLAMVAKLDYALQFWSELSDYLCLRDCLVPPVGPACAQRVEAALARANVSPELAGLWSAFESGEYSGWIGLLVELSRAPQHRELWEAVRKEVAMDAALATRVARDQAALLVAILRRIVMGYRGLIRGANAEGSPIGVGFSYLRSDDREKRFALYELLSGGGDARERGLRWLIDEIASWELLG
jgi:hypothetical protein